MRWIFLTSLIASCGVVPLSDGACRPTYGDSCGCERQCMTDFAISMIGGVCDMDCGDIGWSCVAVAGRCEVDVDGDGLRDEPVAAERRAGAASLDAVCVLESDGSAPLRQPSP